MAKKSSTVFYCGFCDMTLAKSEGVVYDTVHYCGDLCCKLAKKRMHLKDDLIACHRRRLSQLRTGRVTYAMLKADSKMSYKRLEDVIKTNPVESTKDARLQLCIFGHIHNGNKEKALKAFEKFKTYSAEQFEEMCQNPENHNCVVCSTDGIKKEKVTGEENVRIAGVIWSLEREIFKLNIDIM
jgi:hypothetical protein